MKSQFKDVSSRSLRLILLTACITLSLSSVITADVGESSPSSKVHYLLKLTLNEFSILNASEVEGLLKYGGSGDFQLQMAKEGNDVTWTVTIDNPRLMELLGIFVGEKTVKLVQGLNPNSIDPSEKVALEAIKSLTQKMEYAQKNPIWDSIKLSVRLVQQGTNWMIQTADGVLSVVGTNRTAVSGWAGRRVVADGAIKVPG